MSIEAETVQLWNAEERAAWSLPIDKKPSQWAEENRILGVEESNIPGPWRNDNAPYLRGMMDIAVAPGVIQLNIKKSGQVGASEGVRNLMLYWAALEPDPVGLALPDRVVGRRITTNRVIPAFRNTAATRRLFTDRKKDIKAEQIRLVNGFVLHLMWAGSSSSTSSEPMRRNINDEVDKPGFSQWGGQEPNAIGRTWTRLRSYEDRKLQINISTPTNRYGNIHKLVEASTYVLEYLVPCPHCGERQKLIFRQLKWETPKGKRTHEDKIDLADKIERDEAVWYECARCGHRIRPDEKAPLVRAGLWGTLDGEITDAESITEWPRGTRLAMPISVYNCLWESWASVAAEFLRAEGDRSKTYTWRTETCGEVWEEQLERPRPSLYAGKSERARLDEGIIPAWTAKVLATIDTQHDHFFVVLRAWGPEMRSQRIFHGRVESFEDLDRLCFRQPFPVEGGSAPPMQPEMALIDSGGTKLRGESASRTMEVYRWVLRRGSRVRAIKGAEEAGRHRPGLYIWPGKGVLDDGRGHKGKGKTLRIWFLDKHHFGDLLHDLVTCGVADEDNRAEKWLLNKRNDEDYNSQLASVQKILMEARGRLVERWMPVEEAAQDHYWDCENYQVAAAYMTNVDLLPTEREMNEHRKQAEQERQEREGAARRRRKQRGSGWDIRPWDE